jgi:bifunctional UDP-N-acetylglucosamine pyrophosphorylase / glucosamine-1-phosphate N-acetyltransferase
VTLKPGVRIGPGARFERSTFVGADATLDQGCLLRAATVGLGATVLKSVCEATAIEAGATVGPFAHITAQNVSTRGSGARERGQQDEES